MTKNVIILGTHGVPARHGGFETFAEKLSLYLVERGWTVTVTGVGDHTQNIVWNGIHCRYLQRAKAGFLKYIFPLIYDFWAVTQACRTKGVILTLGYNTAIFNILPYMLGRKQIINMDGLEWKRSKYKPHERAWLKLNERAGLHIADVCISDHAAITTYLKDKNPNKPIETLLYGAEPISENDIDMSLLDAYGLQPGQYGLVIARSEPENQILEIVTGWTQSGTVKPLLVVGPYHDSNAYHRAVKQAAGLNVIFPGPLYDPTLVKTLRYCAGAYLHGHTVGGTNPSMVEAMAAGSLIIAHDNPFNRGTCRDSALYFSSSDDLARLIYNWSAQPEKYDVLRDQVLQIYQEHYTWPPILAAYEELLARFV